MPIIVFGTRAITRVKQKGAFHCPECGVKALYHWKRVRNWGQLYWIPILPGEILGEYVECQACRNTFRPGVLEYSDPEEGRRAFRASYQDGIKRVMVGMMLADGQADDAEFHLLQRIFLEIAGRELDGAELDAAVRAAADGEDLITALRKLEGDLNDQGKIAVYKAAYMVASADGALERPESELLLRIGTALRLSLHQMQEVARDLDAPRP
jgi:uncharacterized tellurite resistance protein B-like protein